MSSNMITANCTYCNHPIQAPSSSVDRLVKCTHCSRFFKLSGQALKRFEMNCPHCSAQWKIPFKNRGELYECWNCHEKVQIPEAPQFIITSVATMEQVEQGGEGYQFTLCL
ncbi:MAG TPA: hypothetical protein P5543_11520, partial [Planctomycetota bacterium]|nr:hypothetical protein [Planctomycetota bacterium]